MTRTALILCALGFVACKGQSKQALPSPPAITQPWADNFDRTDLGNDYYKTADAYQLSAGQLNAQGAKNHPLWLRKKLPRDVVVEFDVMSKTPDGDIKVELFGDGQSYDPDGGAYVATSYVLVMGGWGNTKSIIARLDEHNENKLVAKTGTKVIRNKRYHWKIVRRGNRLDWYVGDMNSAFLSYVDPEPLAGPGHEYFAFNNWKSDLWFDNLRIEPAQ